MIHGSEKQTPKSQRAARTPKARSDLEWRACVDSGWQIATYLQRNHGEFEVGLDICAAFPSITN